MIMWLKASDIQNQVFLINQIVSMDYLTWPKTSGIQRNLSSRVLGGHLPEARPRTTEDFGNVQDLNNSGLLS